MPEKPQQQVTFPRMNVNVTPQGVVITTHLTPLSAFTQVLDLATIKQMLPLIKDIRRHIMGGKPSKSTPRDMRLKENQNLSPRVPQQPMKKPAKKGN